MNFLAITALVELPYFFHFADKNHIAGFAFLAAVGG